MNSLLLNVLTIAVALPLVTAVATLFGGLISVVVSVVFSVT